MINCAGRFGYREREGGREESDHVTEWLVMYDRMSTGDGGGSRKISVNDNIDNLRNLVLSWWRSDHEEDRPRNM